MFESATGDIFIVLWSSVGKTHFKSTLKFKLELSVLYPSVFLHDFLP